MFGSRWDKAEATIAARLPQFSGDGSVSYEFVADVRPESGAPAFRATLKPPTIATDFWPPNIGDVVSVLVKSNGKVKFDKDDRRISVKAYEAGQRAAFDSARSQTPGARPGAAGSPGAGCAQDPAARLGKLENLRTQGLLSDAEYAAQRQRILDEL